MPALAEEPCQSAAKVASRAPAQHGELCKHEMSATQQDPEPQAGPGWAVRKTPQLLPFPGLLALTLTLPVECSGGGRAENTPTSAHCTLPP